MLRVRARRRVRIDGGLGHHRRQDQQPDDQREHASRYRWPSDSPERSCCEAEECHQGRFRARYRVQKGQGLIENAYRTSPYAVPVFLERTSHTAVLGEPLRYHDRVIGAVLLDRETAPFTAPDRDLLRLFADQAAIAIEHARLYTDLKRSYEDLRQVQDELIRTEKLRGLGQMAAGIAHDLNNTLATILGQVELLRLRPCPRRSPRAWRSCRRQPPTGPRLCAASRISPGSGAASPSSRANSPRSCPRRWSSPGPAGRRSRAGKGS